MTFRIIILPQAHRDIDWNADWSADQHSVEQAVRWADTVYNQIETLADFPESGLLGQVLSIESAVLNSASCALFFQKLPSETATAAPDLGQLFSTVMTTRDLLDSGHWKIMGMSDIEVPRTQFPFESLRDSGFIGANVVGSRNIEEFANAYCGHSLWDDWADPQYLDRLLISQDVKPSTLRYKAS